MGCRGGHDPANEMNPDWQPYTPQDRLQNLRLIRSKFQIALSKGQLCVRQDSSSSVHPVKWLWKDAAGDEMTPESFGEKEFCQQVGTCGSPSIMINFSAG